MLDASMGSGIAHRRCVFEVFARALPEGRRYGLVVGTQRVIKAILDFGFSDEELKWLQDAGVVSAPTAKWLAGYRFSGSVDGYREGEVYMPGSPVLTVESSFAEAVLLETVVLSILNYDSAVASTASRVVSAARGRMLVEMGSRRIHEEAAVAAARAAYIAGFDSTSNLEAGYLYGVPTAGTSAHSFTMAHPSELEAFRAQVDALGPSTTLLVDTYDISQGIANALSAAGPGLGAIRIDSGDLAVEARKARAALDKQGAHQTRILVSGELDEARIAQLLAEGAPVDAFGVGTHLVVGSNCPSPGFVYKVVAVAAGPGKDGPLKPVSKRGGVKSTIPGPKRAFRQLDRSGQATAEVVIRYSGEEGASVSSRAERPYLKTAEHRSLQIPLIRSGEVVAASGTRDAKDHCRSALQELPRVAFELAPGRPCLPTLTETSHYEPAVGLEPTT
ncbi:MAG: nicotinate phosphoribosyltransferase [Actinobacteria bacterium]|nr:nicotinate phosphoribosyltransferase [Actinomycetota bacterium]